METEGAETCSCLNGVPQRLAMSRGPEACREIVKTCRTASGNLTKETRDGLGRTISICLRKVRSNRADNCAGTDYEFVWWHTTDYRK
jgi:hypothetical protein